jgi:hypothetical protein
MAAHLVRAVRVLRLGAAGQDLEREPLAVGADRQHRGLPGRIAPLLERGLDAEHAHDRGDGAGGGRRAPAAVDLPSPGLVLDGQAHHV